MSKIISNLHEAQLKAIRDFRSTFQQLWQQGMTLTQLGNQIFLKWYKQPKRWLIYKPLKGPSIDQQKLQAVRVKVSNNSIQQQSSQQIDKFVLPCQLKDHDAVKIQTFEEYENLHLKHKQINDFLNQKYEGPIDEQKETQKRSERKKLEQDLFSQLFLWKDKKIKFRIIIIAKKQGFEDLNYFIYNQELPFEARVEFPPLKSTVGPQDQNFLMMKEIIKIHHIKQKNETILSTIKQVFKLNINNSFIQNYKLNKKSIIYEIKKIADSQKLKESFKNYELAQYKEFIDSWKIISKQKFKLNLFIQVFSVWISKINTPVSVKLVVDKSKDNIKEFQFKEIDSDYLVYKIPQDSLNKCFLIDIDGHQFAKEITFQLEIKLKNQDPLTYTNKFVVYLIEKEDNLFLNELVLQSNKSACQDDFCIIYFSQAFSKGCKLNSLGQYLETSLFESIGDIPSKYSSTYRIDYNPSTYKSIKTILSRSNSVAKISRISYQKTYYQLVMASIKQQNQSQRSISLLPTNKKVNKFLMGERYKAYVSKLLQGLGYLSKDQSVKVFFQINHPDIADVIMQSKHLSINKIHHKNLQQDMNLYNPKNQSYLRPLAIRFIYFCGKIKNLESFPYSLRYSSHLIPIFQKFFILYLSSKQIDIRRSSIDKIMTEQDYIYTLIMFLAKLYPYSSYSNLKSDLYIIRWLVQKHLSYFNDTLNRRNIGLQNLVTPYLLHFFSNLSSQLTYRIWDFLIISQKRQQARIIVCFTLLTFFQATDTIPFIPINQFMDRVQLNMKKLAVDKQFANKFSKISDIYFASENTKQNRLIKHLKTSSGISLIDDKILKKLILGESKPTIPYEQQGKIPISKSKHLQIENKLTIKQLQYPLPQPQYAGYNIIEIIIFINDMHILENINLNSNKFWLKLSIPNSSFQEYIQVSHKDHFYNKTVKISLKDLNESKIKKDTPKQIIVEVVSLNANPNNPKEKVQKVETVYLSGLLQYGSYHKDKAYKTCVILDPLVPHNKGKSILNLSFCLKSTISSRNDHSKINYTPLQVLSQKLLDYDIGENNECCIMHESLASNFQKIKFPLDQFKSDQYARLTNRALSHDQPQWLQSSLVSIEQLKAIFYSSFTYQRQKSLKHQFSKYYEIFAEENKMQYIYFSELMLKCITLAQISRKKKLMYIYCLATHYQNIYSKSMSSQTLNSIIRLLYKQNGLMNACPFQASTCGKIIQAYYFESDVKTEQKIDFTEIVQDWAHICNFKYGYSDIILGSARDLSFLRSLFDVKAIKKMEQQKQCRFQVIYQFQGFKYLWSVVVDTKTFAIVKRGSKFLNQFTTYNEIQYLDSTQQFLLNCQNVIPLQSHRTYNYEEFTNIMLDNHLIRYLLDLQVQIDPNSNNIQEEKVEIIDYPDKQKNKEKKCDQYKNWAIYRSQNCLQSWHRCTIENPGKTISKCKFQFDKNHQYSVATLDILSMQQIDLRNDKK